MPRGIYIRTEEHNKINSESHKGKIRSKEHCKKISEARRGHGRGHSVSDETKQKLRDINLGKKHSEETKKKMSKLAAERLQRNPETLKPKYFKSGYYYSKNNGKVWYRSSWELLYMKHLDEINELWEYEKHSFDLGDCCYIPDFYLPNRDEFHEIKGYSRGIDKIEKLRKLYPEIKLSVLKMKELQEFGVV